MSFSFVRIDYLPEQHHAVQLRCVIYRFSLGNAVLPSFVLPVSRPDRSVRTEIPFFSFTSFVGSGSSPVYLHVRGARRNMGLAPIFPAAKRRTFVYCAFARLIFYALAFLLEVGRFQSPKRLWTTSTPSVIRRITTANIFLPLYWFQVALSIISRHILLFPGRPDKKPNSFSLSPPSWVRDLHPFYPLYASTAKIWESDRIFFLFFFAAPMFIHVPFRLIDQLTEQHHAVPLRCIIYHQGWDTGLDTPRGCRK